MDLDKTALMFNHEASKRFDCLQCVQVATLLLSLDDRVQ